METVIQPVRGMLDQVISCVREVAAKEVMPRYLKVAHQRKSDGSLFTEADLAAQEALSRVLPEIYPGPIVGEEMTPEQQAEHWLAGTEGLWCVDPIDGTSNFVNGLPYFAVSVALMKQRPQRAGRGLRPGGRRDVLCRAGRRSLPEWRAAADQGACAAPAQRHGAGGFQAPARAPVAGAGGCAALFVPAQFRRRARWNGAMSLRGVSTSTCMAARSCGTTRPAR